MICLPCNFRCWPSRYTWIHRSKSYPKTSVIKTRRQSFDPQTRPNQIKSLKLTTTPPRRQVPDKTHVHMHPSWSPRVLDSDHWHHTPGWPSATEILSQFKSLPPTATYTTFPSQGTVNRIGYPYIWGDGFGGGMPQVNIESEVHLTYILNLDLQCHRGLLQGRGGSRPTSGWRRWSHFDWCCFYYFVKNSLVALLEALCARNISIWSKYIHHHTNVI